MLRRYKIKSDSKKEQDKFAILTWDDEEDIYHISIPEDINPMWLPAIPMLWWKKGVYEINDKFARRFVKERVIPPERQNIGEVLKKIGVKRYSEMAIIEYCTGRCCMDDFCVERIE